MLLQDINRFDQILIKITIPIFQNFPPQKDHSNLYSCTYQEWYETDPVNFRGRTSCCHLNNGRHDINVDSNLLAGRSRRDTRASDDEWNSDVKFIQLPLIIGKWKLTWNRIRQNVLNLVWVLACQERNEYIICWEPQVIFFLNTELTPLWLSANKQPWNIKIVFYYKISLKS